MAFPLYFEKYKYRIRVHTHISYAWRSCRYIDIIAQLLYIRYLIDGMAACAQVYIL